MTLALLTVPLPCFQQLIASEKKQGTGADHFAKAGANDRVWNALEKHCLLSPENFASYYSNTLLALVCQAWLGPLIKSHRKSIA